MGKIVEVKGKFYYEDEDGIDYNDEIKEIKVCGCDNDYLVPLIWTFAFCGSEYWCPYCGTSMGMMGAGEAVPLTKEIFERGKKYTELSKAYLSARSSQICNTLMFEGKRITPDKLPKSEKQKNIDIINNWKYNVKI